jgi:predicted methyltransferase
MKILVFGALLALSLPVFPGDANIDKAVANPERTAADRERDQRDKPAEVLEFAGVKPGMTVADIFSAGGYYTELLADAVGPTGKVLAIDNLGYATFSKDERKARYTEGRLKNVDRRLIEASWFDVGQHTVDIAFLVMAFHDTYWVDEKSGWAAINNDGFIDSVRRLLKPGGKLVIVDHNAPAGSGPEQAQKVHRLNEDFVKKTLAARGFVFEKSYDGLRNKTDQYDKYVYDAAVKGKTDRYVLMFKAK